jgi:MFS family permease
LKKLLPRAFNFSSDEFREGKGMITELDKTAPKTSHRAVLAVTCIALATVVSAVASLNVAIPSIARDTHATQTQLSWMIDAYSLVFAALLLPAGGLGDRFGRRKALLAGLVVFGAGSVAAMSHADADWLIGMRAVLGLGAALVMPATLATITSTFPAAQRAKAVGTWAGVAGASAILGLLTSGVVLEQWSWRSVFAVNIVLAVVAIAGTLRVVPESADPDAPRVDWVGAAIAVAGLGALVYSIIEAPTEGWRSARTLLGLGAGVVLLAGFIFLLLQYLQLVLHDSPLVSAISLVPMALAMMPSARFGAPKLVARAGTGRTCAAGLFVAAAGFAWLATLDASSSYWALLAGLVPLGAGMGLAMTPATAAVTDALPHDKQGVGSAMNDLSRELGGALGIAVLGSILQSIYRNHLDVSGLPSGTADHARSSLALASRLGPAVAHSAQSAFVDGMQYALYGSAAAVAAAGVAVLVLHRK